MGVASGDSGAQVILSLLCALMCGGQALAGQQVEAELRSHAEIYSTRFTLGDLARIDGGSDARRRDLSALVLGDSPRMGYSKTYLRSTIERKVARLHPSSRGKIKWRGADHVTVRGKGQSVDPATVADAAALELARIHGEHYKSLELRPSGELEEQQVPAGKVTLRARAMPAEAVARRVGVRVEIRIDERHYRTVPVWFEGKAVRQVLTARYPRQPGEALRTSDFDWTAVDVATYASAPVPAEELKADRLRLRQSLAAGEPLLREHVEERPAVARNDNVKVAVARGGIVIEASGIALADARVGEAVKVRNPQSNEQYAALVVAPGVVRIELR